MTESCTAFDLDQTACRTNRLSEIGETTNGERLGVMA